ncbi:uncharacterized protein LAESUDRAFT_654834 [Laetiporus sulphureus 93-53]|uniref:Uncharacterized protein n=1 Tax=Laetiporus sulphureus 93-53 TaxID=1314785 RepID=A0A165DZT4_9APHY|nr:uncharacterized protein LAESUDRAFT_654834 [Laetiporus sulphureus 93-53]KZT05973.1 hypothetical protein LAESUDRAFT_654834 [Laetiporus sulphureus 93-53]
MADLEPQSPTSTATHGDVVAGIQGPETHSEEHEEHEAASVVGAPPESTPVAEGVAEGHAEDNMAQGSDAAATPADSPTSPHAENMPTETVKENTPAPQSGRHTAKPSISVKPGTKTTSAPPTPLVKKVISSGTFGSGVKHAPAPGTKTTGIAAAAATKPASATILRKSSSTSSVNPPTKPAMASSRSGATGVAGSTTTAVRRQSVVPKAPTPTSAKAPTSSSARTPTASSTASAAKSGTAGSRATPDASAAPGRPRASVSGEAKRTSTIASRSTVAPNNRPPSTTSTRSTRLAGSASISSIKEVKNDSKTVEKLHNKASLLKEATDSLISKADVVKELEAQVNELKSSLKSAQAEVETRRSAVEMLEESKAAAEQQLAILRNQVAELQSGGSEEGAALKSIRSELEAATAAHATEKELVAALQSQIQALESEVAAGRHNLDALRSSSSEQSSASAAAAEVEHIALLKAKEDLEAIKLETESLKAAHTEALADAQTRMAELEEKATRVEILEAQLAKLKAENGEKSMKVSELEVEILEMKEEQEKSEDERAQAIARIRSLEEEITKASEAMQKALEEASASEAEKLGKADEALQELAQELNSVRMEYAGLSDKCKSLDEELAKAIQTHEQAKAEIDAQVEAHTAEIRRLQDEFREKESQLIEQMKTITAELESQEAKYNAKVDAVKADHDELLKQAFERARNEAGSAHSQDLQALRAESQATIEQLRTAHEVSVESLKAEHQAALESQVKTLEKQIAQNNLELKATHDDLQKAKTAFASSSQELESVKSQLDEARQIAATIDRSDKDEMIVRLSKELSNARDDHASLQDMFTATKESLTEVSKSHALELEDAARVRAEEVIKLRAAHDEQLKDLTTEKSELQSKVSDLEGELATLKATVAAEPVISPRTNGSAHAHASNATRDELQRLHEAHNLKMLDLQAAHERSMQEMREQLEIALAKASELAQEVERKTMEIKYLEQDQEESQDQLTRYVKIFGLKSFVGAMCTLVVVYGLF